MTLRLTRKAPLGHRADGSAFWAYFGSEPDEDGDDGQGGDGGGGEDDDSDDSGEDDDRIGDDGLTGKGRRAIQAERATAQKARERLKPVNALFRKYGVKNAAELDALLAKSTKGTSSKKDAEDDGPSAEEIREQARREASEAANTRLIRAGVKTVAADLLNDPKDALAFLDLSDYEVDENGDIDEAQVKRDLKALIADKPYLGKAKKGDGRTGGTPNFDGGTRKTSTKSSMNEFIRRGAGVIR